MPGDGLAHGPPAKQKAGGSHHRFSQSSGIPCAMVLRLMARSPRGPGLIAPVARNIRGVANLTSASGGQDHTISPSVSGSLVRRDQHVHRSPPHVS
jgi:hypothetical protein